MNPRIKELAEEAGFCFWDDEEWKPHDAVIDWSAQYDKEFQKYTELLINECITSVYNRGKLYEIKDAGEHQSEVFANAIRKHFGIEDE